MEKTKQTKLFKKKLIEKPIKNLDEKKFKFKTVKLKPMLKNSGGIKVCFKANRANAQVVVKNLKQKNGVKLKVHKKMNKTTLNQFYVVANFKTKQLFNKNLKSKNVFYLVKHKSKILKGVYLLIIGLFIGFINGFWGGGGGMICVPTLTMLLKMPDKKAHATTILIMLPLSIASFVVYMLKGTIEWQTAAFVSGGFVVGGIAGALILKKINNVFLRIIFSLVIIAGAIKMLI